MGRSLAFTPTGVPGFCALSVLWVTVPIHTPALKDGIMAQRVNIELVDDIDGSEAVETVSFTLDGTAYEMDLSEKNAAKIREALDPFVNAARKVSRVKANSRRSTPSGPSAADVRTWAQAHGHEVPERGRIPAVVREAYAAAN